MKEWSVDGNLYFEINDEKAKLLYKYICDLQQEIERLNRLLNQADNKNLELIEMINKIYDIIENENITGIEARLMIQNILDKENE